MAAIRILLTKMEVSSARVLNKFWNSIFSKTEPQTKKFYCIFLTYSNLTNHLSDYTGISESPCMNDRPCYTIEADLPVTVRAYEALRRYWKREFQSVLVVSRAQTKESATLRDCCGRIEKWKWPGAVNGPSVHARTRHLAAIKRTHGHFVNTENLFEMLLVLSSRSVLFQASKYVNRVFCCPNFIYREIRRLSSEERAVLKFLGYVRSFLPVAEDFCSDN